MNKLVNLYQNSIVNIKFNKFKRQGQMKYLEMCEFVM